MIWTQDREVLYNTEDIALLLGVCRRTIEKRSRQAGLQKRIIHRVRYYSEEDIRQMFKYYRDKDKEERV